MNKEAVARHLANRADLVAARDALQAKWDAEDATVAAARAEHMAKFEQGLRDVDAVIVTDGGEVPVEVAPEPDPAPAPEPEHHDEIEAP
jgi:hypothetical protein